MEGKSTIVILAIASAFAVMASNQACFLIFNQPKMPKALRRVDQLL